VTLEAKNLDAAPDETITVEHGEIRLAKLPGATIGRAEFAPGWRWSADVRPRAGTDSCQAHHVARATVAVRGPARASGPRPRRGDRRLPERDATVVCRQALGDEHA